MNKNFYTSILFCLTYGFTVHSQNVGIGTNAPSEKLEVGGMIYTNQGGIKFPDETIQTTAAMNNSNYENGVLRRQAFIIFDGVADTFEIIELSQGGVLTNGNTSGQNQFKMKVNIEPSSITLWNRHFTGQNTPKATIHFRQSTSPLSYYTIELRNAFVASLDMSTSFLGTVNYAHAMEIALHFISIEIRSFPGNNCYCWNYQTNNSCGCD